MLLSAIDTIDINELQLWSEMLCNYVLLHINLVHFFIYGVKCIYNFENESLDPMLEKKNTKMYKDKTLK